jgi:acyl-CoA synthetase (NDP forming)
VISAGFAETGAEGRVLQDELRHRARATGVRLIGPNCMGLLNGGPDPRFNATFSTVFPPPGRLAFVSQSGGLGLAALALFTGPSLGVSGFVSVGNTADLTPNDLLLYWDEDPATGLILAYLESVPDPRRFARIARRLSRHKPIVVVKSGRTGAGRRAASSHTAALAARDTAVEALVHQAGVIRAGTLEEMFDVAAVMSSQPLPAGRRVAVLTNVGGPGILVADACEAAGLLVPELPTTSRRRCAPACRQRQPSGTRWTSSPGRAPSSTGGRCACSARPKRSTRSLPCSSRSVTPSLRTSPGKSRPPRPACPASRSSRSS